MKINSSNDTRRLGQFIPIQYHFNMLLDTARMQGFRKAAELLVPQDGVVLELGGGTGCLSFFAAKNARKVYLVELNLDLVDAARSLLAKNENGHKVEVIHDDAFEYMPPEPVDVVICEMLHVGLLREKQAQVIASFKERYALAYPDAPMPIFIPGATLQAVQPVSHDFNFEGYHASVVQFQDPYSLQPRTTELGNPTVFQQFMYDQPYPFEIAFDGVLPIATSGTLNALRVITKNILAATPAGEIIDWHNQYLIHPLETPIEVTAGDNVNISFAYTAGDSLTTFAPIVTA
jgi:predicted RNA methylase